MDQYLHKVMGKINPGIFSLTILFLLMQAVIPGFVHAKNPIKIAIIYPFTGNIAEDASLSVAGVNFAVNEINKNGGINGRPIKIFRFDNLSSPIGSKIAAKAAVKAGVSAIVGPVWSSHAIIVAKIAQAAGIPMIANIATNPKLTRIGNFIFRVCYTDDFQGNVMARFAIEYLKTKNAVIFKDISSDFSIGLSDKIKKKFELMGGTIIKEIYYKHTQETFDDSVKALIKDKPEVIFFTGHFESAFIIKAAEKIKLKAIPIGSDAWGSNHFYEKGGNTIKLGYYCSHWNENINTEKSKNFVKKYGYIGKLYSSHALAYDAVMLLADAIKRAGSTQKVKIRDALCKTKLFKGVTGSISFNEWGDPIKPVVIIKILNGKPELYKVIYPESIK